MQAVDIVPIIIPLYDVCWQKGNAIIFRCRQASGINDALTNLF